ALNSYPSHLALGIYLKKQGLEARGTKYISETSDKELNKMREYLTKARAELSKSLQLTKKPYLSIFHLLDISSTMGEKNESYALLKKANTILPSNSLARNRYLNSITPRWGGSYSEVDRFIESCKSEGAPNFVIAQLQAVKFQDKGLTFYEKNNYQAASE